MTREQKLEEALRDFVTEIRAYQSPEGEDCEIIGPLLRQADAALSAPKAEAETLPCDVQLPGALLRKGVSMDTLMFALKRREGWSEEDTRLRAPPVPTLTAGEEAGGVKVKALEWTDRSNSEYAIRWDASSEAEIRYIARAVRPNDMVLCNGSYYLTVDQAKAAAQADYERRVLSALESTPSPIVDDAMVKEIREIIDDLNYWAEKLDDMRRTDGGIALRSSAVLLSALNDTLSGAREGGE